MKIKLVELNKENKDLFLDMIEEWTTYNKEHPEANHSPWAIFRNDYHDFDNYVKGMKTLEPKEGMVPDHTLFALDEERNIFVGAVNFRHELNEGLLFDGGHIGDGIRPSERRKGYGKEMIRLALEECRSLGIERVLMVCDKDNIASAKTIIDNGGILENEVISNEGVKEQRYWIILS